MRWLSLFLVCQYRNLGKTRCECEEQSRFKVQAVAVFRYDWCKMSSFTPWGTRTPSWTLLFSTSTLNWVYQFIWGPCGLSLASLTQGVVCAPDGGPETVVPTPIPGFELGHLVRNGQSLYRLGQTGSSQTSQHKNCTRRRAHMGTVKSKEFH
jgi:hypothetical protein